MSDPKQGNLYHLILGIPDEVVSPNHYELLGLDHRVSDPATINKAAADQNRKLLHWQNSDRYAEVRALTFEVVHARDVLLNEATRTAYDQALGDWGLEDEGPWIEEEPAEPLSVRCPECSASFKLRNRELVGRRLPCPDCGHRFTVRPEGKPVAELLESVGIVLLDDADSDAELAALDNFEDMGEIAPSPRAARRRNVFTVESYREADEYEDEERTSRSTARRPARRPKPRRAGTRSRSRAWIIAGGVLVFIICVVLAGALLFRSGPSSPIAETQLAYLPADSSAVAYYRMGDVARSPFFQDHLTRSVPLRNQVDEFRGRTGMELTDLDTIVIGLKDNHLNRFSSLGRMQNVNGLKFVAVARSNKDWDRSRLIGDHTESATHNGQTYHRFSPDVGSSDDWALYLPDARTLIFGTEAEVKAAIDTEGKAPGWRDMEFFRPEYPVIAAGISGAFPSRVRGPRPVGGNLPITMNAVTLGSGLIFTPAEIRDVSFLRFQTTAEADQFRRAVGGSDLERQRFGVMPRAAGSVKFTQHGRTVAVEQGNFHRLAEIRNGSLATVPLCLLARLGKGSVQSTDRSPLQTNDAGNLKALINGGLPRPNPPGDDRRNDPRAMPVLIDTD